jgi:hypothetical protein
MNYLRTSLLAVFCITIAGCGKPIVECGDPAVPTIINDILTNNGKKAGDEFEKKMPGLIAALATEIVKKMPFAASMQPEFSGYFIDPKPLLIFKEKKFTNNSKLSDFVSKSKNKETGINTCSARVTGSNTLAFSISINKEAEKAINDWKQAMWNRNEPMSFAKIVEAAVNESPELKGTLTATSSADSVVLVYTLGALDSIDYTVGMTDSKDKVLVEVLGK